MPTTNEGILLVIGALFLLLGLLGGGFEISAIKVPPIGNYTRVITLVIGVMVFGAGLYRLLFVPNVTVPPVIPPTTVAVLSTATFTPIPSPTPLAPTNTPTVSPSPAPPSATPVVVNTRTPASVQLQDVRVEYDVTRFERKGMVVHIKMQVNGLKDVESRAVAYFYQRAGEPLKDVNGKFTTVDGNVSASQSFTPTTANAGYDNLEVFLPYDELELGPGSYQLKFFVSVYDMRNTQTALANSLDIDFDFSK